MSLRVEIDGSWSAEDFARMFASVNDILRFADYREDCEADLPFNNLCLA